MKDLVYSEHGYGLPSGACIWLREIGLKETRWILDAEWIMKHDNTTFNKWMREN